MSNSINLDNKYRVLLTEVLPYELPFRLNNDAFYEDTQNKELKALFDEVVKNKKNGRYRLIIMCGVQILKRVENLA